MGYSSIYCLTLKDAKFVQMPHLEMLSLMSNIQMCSYSEQHCIPPRWKTPTFLYWTSMSSPYSSPSDKNKPLFPNYSTAVYAPQGGNSVFLLISTQLSICPFLIYSCELFLHLDIMLWVSEDKHIWIPECQKDFKS